MIPVLFAVGSRCTFLGNHWQAVAQILMLDGKDIWGESGMSTDEEVRKRLRGTGRNTDLVSVGSPSGSNRSESGAIQVGIRRVCVASLSPRSERMKD